VEAGWAGATAARGEDGASEEEAVDLIFALASEEKAQAAPATSTQPSDR
jgi:hypothetical protein